MRRLWVIVLILMWSLPASLGAQMPGGEGGGILKPPPLSGPQRKTLLLIAREAVEAVLEARESRQATVEPRLMVHQPLVVSIYVDGELRSRSWRLKPDRPLYIDARDVTYDAVNRPRDNGFPLSEDELARAEIGLAVLSGYTRAQDERDVPPRSAVIVLSGFTEAVGLPGDVESDDAADLLSHASERAGLRPRVWLLPQTTIFFAGADMFREERLR